MRKLFLMLAALMMMMIAVPVFAGEREGYPYKVGDKVWAKIEDTEEGSTLFFCSRGGTLSRNWKKTVPLSSVSVIRFAPESGKMYLPEDSSYLFYYLEVKKIELDKADTSNVTDMSYMFCACYGLTNLNVSSFDTSKVTNMNSMFGGCTALKSLDLRSFNTSRVTDMDSLLSGCSALRKLDLGSFDTSNVTEMSYMFSGCSRLKSLDLSSFDTSKVTDMSDMFGSCLTLANLNLSGFDTSNVRDMSEMFRDCSALTNLDLSNFDTSKVTSMRGMFYSCSDLQRLDLRSFDTSNVTDLSAMFIECVRLTSLNVGSFDTSKVTNMSEMFSYCKSLTSLDVSGFDTSNVTSMGAMFLDCLSLTNLDVSGFDTSKATNLSYTFSGCSGLTSLDVSGFDTSNVTNIDGLFFCCSGLTSLDVSSFNTSNVTTIHSMFYNCSGLKDLDVSSFDTSKVTFMSSMFQGCSGLTSLDVSGFDTSNVTWLGGMFSGCSGLTNLDVSGFDTSKVTEMYEMFRGCSGLTSLDVSGFDTSNVTYIWNMFRGCSGLTSLDLGNFVLSKYDERSRFELLSDCDALEKLVTPIFGERKSYPPLPFAMCDSSGRLYERFPADSIALTRCKQAPAALIVADIATNASTDRNRSTTLKVGYDGDGTLSFASSNPRIRVYSDGRVTIPKNFSGTAIITVKSSATAGYMAAEAKARITVSSLANAIKAKDVTMTASAKSQSFTIAAAQKGNGKLTFESDTKSVTVGASGKVTAAKNFSGRAKITIKAVSAMPYRAAAKTVSVIIKPAKVTSGTAKNSAAGKITLSWKRAAGAEGYQIQYSTSRDFKSRKSGTTKNLKATLSRLTKGKTWYVRIRSYKKDAEGNLFSAWARFKAVEVTD